MNETNYRTDITEAEFEQIKPCLNIQRTSKWSMVSIINAIFYVCGEGIKWRALPKDMEVPWQTVYWYFAKWTRQGTWQSINETLVMTRRQSADQPPVPKTIIIDSQSTKKQCYGYYLYRC